MPIIVLSGNIGAGKSTLLRALEAEVRRRAPRLEVVVMPEQVDSSMLAMLYDPRLRMGMTDDAFKLFFQTEKQHARWRNVMDAKRADARGALVLMDTGPRHDSVFAHVNLDHASYVEAYCSTFRRYRDGISFTPNLRLFVDTPAAQCLRNVQRRACELAGRECEVAITQQYLEQLEEAFILHSSTLFPDCRREVRLRWSDVNERGQHVDLDARNVFERHVAPLLDASEFESSRRC